MAKRTEKGICGICPANCGVEIGLENDRIVNIHPWKEHPQGIPCVRGRHAPDIIYSSDRLKTPLKEKGQKAHWISKQFLGIKLWTKSPK